MERAKIRVFPKIVPPLDPDFLPANLWNRAFRQEVGGSGLGCRVLISLERSKESSSFFEVEVFSPGLSPPAQEASFFYLERMVKNLLWMRGGRRLTVFGPAPILEPLTATYSIEGERAFDVDLMTRAYGQPFSVEIGEREDKISLAREKSKPLGGHLDGYRLGFDLGASDWKVAALAEGETVFTAEFPWAPAEASDPRYHYHHLQAALNLAAAHLPRVEAIGGSAAGIYVNNEPRVASLFRAVPQPLFDREVRPLFQRLGAAWQVPLEVANDGEVAALAGSIAFKTGRLLAISMGSSQAGGYVNESGYITDWLNELAFAPVDYRVKAPQDEWSGDLGCGVQYFSQQAVFRLARAAGLELDETLPPAAKLKQVQDFLEKGEKKARLIFETIGVYLGYGLAHYADFYDYRHVLILGRVTSGEAGQIILQKAQQVLRAEFPELSEKVELHLPDERSRRLGQAMAAASLPLIPRRAQGSRPEERNKE